MTTDRPFYVARKYNLIPVLLLHWSVQPEI